MTLMNPFSGGMRTDVPADSVGPTESVFAQDGYSPSGRFQQRKGWEYDGSTADVADNLVGIYRAKFNLAAVTKTVTCDDDGDMFIHEAAAVGTAIFTGSVPFLPRAVYHDELLWCAQDGTTPLRRYSGASAIPTASDGVGTWTDGQATITAITLSGAPTLGTYASVVPSPGSLRNTFRVVESATTSLTLEDVLASQTVAATLSTIPISQTGCMFPAVVVYNAGSIVVDGANVVTGYGTKWVDSLGIVYSTAPDGDAVLIIPATGNAEIGQMTDATPANTEIAAVLTTQATRSPYAITRPCPFKDVAAHKESLWGTGVKQFPSRVYIGPPGWNPSLPPGFSPPFDPTIIAASPNANDFLMDFIDVPAPGDTDANVAILPSPNPLLVLKRQAVYGIFGSFGGLSVDMVADGIGCIDIRSAQSFDEGQFWAGESGIFWYTGGTVRDLTSGKINREWRALTRDFDYGTSDFCTTWLASGHLFVSIITLGGTVTRTYVCDLRDGSWQSRFTNMAGKYSFTSRIPGEKEKALIVGGDIAQGRVANVAPCVDGSGSAKDDAGSFPRLQAYTTSALAQSGGIEGISRMVDLDVHANVLDSGSAGSTQLDISVVQGGGISNTADATTTLTSIDSDTVDRIDRKSLRPCKQGRFHQVRFAVDPLGTDNTTTKVEIAQMVASFRDRRSRA